MRRNANSDSVMTRIIVCAAIGAIFGLVAAIFAGLYSYGIFMVLTAILAGAIFSIGIVFGIRVIFAMCRWLLERLVDVGVRLPIMAMNTQGCSCGGCMTSILMIVLVVVAIIFLSELLVIVFVIIGCIIGCVSSVIELKRAEDADNILNNNIN